MKPKKVICPICGKEMIPKNWGMERDVVYDMLGGLHPLGVKNYVDYECSCGCKIDYKGETDCWKKCEGKCKCKSCVNFQKHYPYYEDKDDNE